MNSKENVFGERLRMLRDTRGKNESSQKGFAHMLGIPQSTLSSYESGKIKPTVDAIINICEKCNVSMDWLCGRDKKFTMNTLGDVMACFLELYGANEFQIETTVHDKVDLEGDNDRCWIALKIYHNEAWRDDDLTLNSTLASIITRAYNLTNGLRRYECDQESYEREKAYYVDQMQNIPITQIDHSKLTDEERRKKMYEYVIAEHEVPKKKSEE